MTIAIVGTLLFAAAAIMLAPTTRSLRARDSLSPPTTRPAALGVIARVTAGGKSVELSMPELNFTVSPDQSLDPGLPPGPFDGRFEATFMPNQAPTATIGAEVQGGQIIIKLAGAVLASEASEGTDVRRVMSRPIPFRMRPYTVSYEFRSYGRGPARLRALWQPEDVDMPLQLPGARPQSEAGADAAHPRMQVTDGQSR
jgi:hypothetical protein